MSQQDATASFSPFQLSPELVELIHKEKHHQKLLDEQKEFAHKNLWDAIHEAHPSLDRKTNYTINLEYLEQGVVMLDEAKNNGSSVLKGVLMRAIAQGK